MMLWVYLKKYRSMVLCSIFFFYLGCGLTLSLLKMDCSEALKQAEINSLSNPHSNVEYAILILSGPGNKDRRDVIRTTWKRLVSNINFGNYERFIKWNSSWSKKSVLPDFVRFYFVIGTKYLDKDKTIQLHYELDKNKDLLLLDDLEDSYKQLPIKMLMALEWFSENLLNLKYLIKCDDDSFVRVDLIIKDLEAFAPSMSAHEIAQYVSFKHELPSAKGLYWGYFSGHAPVFRSGKWQEEDWFLCDYYLPYARGGGYVISKNIVDYIGINNQLLSPYNSEDVSMGVWTAALRSINRVHDIRFDTEWISRGCSDNMFIRHKQTPADMIQMYKNLVNSQGNKLCTNTTQIRRTYRYRWDTPPSGCCK